MLLAVIVVEQWGPVLEGQHDLAAVAVVWPVIMFAQRLEGVRMEALEHLALDPQFLTCT